MNQFKRAQVIMLPTEIPNKLVIDFLQSIYLIHYMIYLNH